MANSGFSSATKCPHARSHRRGRRWQRPARRARCCPKPPVRPKLRPVRSTCECSYLDFQGPLAARYGQGDRCGSFPAKTGVSVCSGLSSGEGEVKFRTSFGVITQTMTDQEKLNILFDRAQIAEAIHRYPVSLDSRNWKLFRSIFTDEIQVYLGPPTDKLKLRTVSADKFTEQVTGVISRFAVTQHFLTDYHVEVNGNEAVCVSYMQARHFKP